MKEIENLTQEEITEIEEGAILNAQNFGISFDDFTEAQLREWNNVFRTNQRYIDPTPIKMEMDILENRLSETKRADRYADIVDRLNELQDKLVEAYDR